MECMNCGTELTGRQRTYCSDKCRMQAKREHEQAVASPVTPKPEQSRTITPLEPEHEQKSNKAVIGFPGDIDYNGCMELVNGQWQHKSTPTKPITEHTRAELYSAIRAYRNNKWIGSPESTELNRRLHTLTLPELEANGYWIPGWRLREAG